MNEVFTLKIHQTKGSYSEPHRSDPYQWGTEKVCGEIQCKTFNMRNKIFADEVSTYIKLLQTNEIASNKYSETNSNQLQT